MSDAWPHRHALWCESIAVALLLLAGCIPGVNNDAADLSCSAAICSSTNSSNNYANLVPRFAIAGSGSRNSILSYAVDAATGQLRPTGYSAPYAAPGGIAFHPSGSFVYAAYPTPNTVSGYALDPTTGALAAIAGLPLATGASSPQGVFFDPQGLFVFMPHGTSGSVAVFRVNPTTGALTAVTGSPFPAGASSLGVAVTPDASHLYVPDQTNRVVYAFALNLSTGALSAIGGSPFAMRGATAAPAYTLVSPDGKTLYTNNAAGCTISAFAIGTSGGLTELAASPFAGHCGTTLALHPSGGFLYETDNATKIAGYTVGAGGALSPMAGTPLATGNSAKVVTLDPGGRFAYVLNVADDEVAQLALDSTTGLPALVSKVRTLVAPTWIAVSGGSAALRRVLKFAYTSNYTASTVSAFSIAPATGALTSIAPAVAAAAQSYFVSVDPLGRYALVANINANNLYSYTVSATGTLTPTGTPPAISSPTSVVPDPSGNFAYAVSNGGSTISAYSVASTGALTALGASLATGTAPHTVRVDPTGQYVYSSNQASNDISGYSIGATGTLTSLGATVPAGTLPYGIAFHPSGRFLYVANNTSNNVCAYLINAATGVLTPVTGALATSTYAAGTAPSDVDVDPTGRLAYVSNYSSNNISTFSINPSTGALSPVGATVPAGTNPNWIAVDPSGSFAYVANLGSNNVSAYAIDPVAGTLTPIGSPVAAGTGPYIVAVWGNLQ
jgi:6-phosphogluconolactonase (cycloisomerase 2 family)